MKMFVLTFLFLSSMPIADIERTSGEAEARCAVRSFQNEYDASEAVFVGEVVKTSQVENKKYFVFKVKRFWKGVRSEKIKLLVYENPSTLR